MKHFLYFLLFSLFFSCYLVDRFNHDTNEFNDYLKNNFNQEIKTDSYHILITMNMCDVCIYETINNIKTYGIKNITIILSDFSSLVLKKPSEELKGFNVLKDLRMNINNLSFFKNEYPTFIQIKRNKIEEIEEINMLKNPQEIFEFFE